MLASCGGGGGGDISPPLPGKELLAVATQSQSAGPSMAVAAFSRPFSDYTLTHVSDTFTLTDKKGAEGPFTFTQPTVLTFTEIAVAVAATENHPGQLYRLYNVFHRAPDLQGLGSWLDGMEKGATLTAVADQFAVSPEFVAMYGSNPSTSAFVTLLYRNVLGREPDPAGLKGWVDYYDRGGVSKGQLITGFTESDENKQNLLPRMQDGIQFIVADKGTFPPPPVAPPRALVLYDAPPGTEYEKLGFGYAIMLRNLLGHFDAQVDLLPIHQYTAGKLNGYDATFYLGAYYDNQPPAAFLADAAVTQKTLVWFKDNIWHLAWDPAYKFTETRGITFSGLRGMNAMPSAANPNPGFFDTVTYKNTAFTKYYMFDSARGAVNADPEIGATTIADAAKASTVVPITNSRTGEVAPYIVRSGKFWYFADLPFSYIGPRDRYLVLTDLLHEILGVQHPENHQALVRLEDVSATVDLQSMKTLSDYLSTNRVPFSIATIPLYQDPLGTYNDGVPQTITFAQATKLRSALNYAVPRGGEIVMHGYTHQYASQKNPNTGVSGDDYEFWNIVANAPVPEDSFDWALGRLNAGLSDLKAGGFNPVAWETPHYQGSAVSSRAAASLFPSTYQRVVYYTADKPNFAAAASKDFAVGQFYPYVIGQDYYGQRVIPENLGNIEYDIHTVDPTSNYNYTAQDIITNAQYARTVRDGYASFFFHPFWLEADLGQPGFEDFKKTITGISQLGFTWIAPSKAN
jgi:uncharacterized protein YdaL